MARLAGTGVGGGGRDTEKWLSCPPQVHNQMEREAEGLTDKPSHVWQCDSDSQGVC